MHFWDCTEDIFDKTYYGAMPSRPLTVDLGHREHLIKCSSSISEPESTIMPNQDMGVDQITQITEPGLDHDDGLTEMSWLLAVTLISTDPRPWPLVRGTQETWPIKGNTIIKQLPGMRGIKLNIATENCSNKDSILPETYILMKSYGNGFVERKIFICRGDSEAGEMDSVMELVRRKTELEMFGE
ncbi:uncharacterized protein BCR38DRAFT_490470 [Pseudomassariella vexata]|uniref:Uncharacterized protein n=1 Tax=Pseudomassariella vexata TaxID=1141098 RepID=A0A1Y2DBK4_9PEZI|nr:uncharacterized protein BCR38DRAFT_490470 [Pseudomassariella vexata]ORY56577.1 hypothetical protein BCR38DRAFT_490470 [Pseudomassariella vexata]